MTHVVTIPAFVVNCLVIIVHVCALGLLIKLKYSRLSGNQHDLLVALCLTELSYAIMDNISKASEFFEYHDISTLTWLFSVITIILMNMSIMILITLDRFLVFYLHLKYETYCSRTKYRIALIILGTFSIMSYIPALCFGLRAPTSFGRRLVRYIYPVFEIIFIIVAISTYSYIFWKHQASILSRKEMGRVTLKPHLKNHFKLLVPSLIILTYFCFMIIPNFIKLCNSLGIIESREIFRIAYILIPIGFLADPVIYIFNTGASIRYIKRYRSRKNINSLENTTSLHKTSSSL